jgi:hypothetical protein
MLTALNGFSRFSRGWLARRLLAGLVALALVPGLFLIGGDVRPAAAACTANPIPCENALPGTPPSVWDPGTSIDAGLQGFATDISVDVGQTVYFKINSTTYTSYQIDIYRMGYYGGDGARLVATVAPSVPLPQTQPACLTQSSTGLVDCGNWTVSASWNVPSTAVSGIYFADLVAPDGGMSQIVFVVRNDASHSDIVFRTDDTTWVAYNDYGGNNLYYGSAPSSNGRAYAVSYNRPFNDRAEAPGYGTSNFVFYAEYPMVRWLEANGYDVSYISSVDLVRSPSLLENHKVLLSAGHDEYWSNEMRSAVETAIQDGVNVANFTGNEDFWKIRWGTSIDGSSTPDRTIICYKETLDNKVEDPADPPIWTGTWRDPRFSPPADGGRPENQLGGTIFMVNRGSTAPVITYPYSRLRFWRDTPVASLQPGQSITLGYQTIGYEWDEDLDNGFRPPGLFDLAATTVQVPELLEDYGSTYGSGTATWSPTEYKAPSGALVFSAGTVQWSWGLDTNHDVSPDVGPDQPDPIMEQATVNILADMGVQPATLQPGLVATSASSDTTPPTSTITSPSSGAAETSGTPVTITGTATDAGGGVVAGVEVSTDGGTTWHPAQGTTSWSYQWTPGPTGTFTVESRAVDDSGNLESPSDGISVTVNPRPCPCSLFSSTATPQTASASDNQSVELGVKFYVDQAGYINGVRFYKGTGNTGTHVGSLWTSSGQLLAQGTFTNETSSGWQTLTFATPVAISADTTYVASYLAPNGGYAVTPGYFTSPDDVWPLHAPAGSNGVYLYTSTPAFPTQTYNATNYWVDVVFNTTYIDTVAPAVTTVSPVPGATGAPFTTTISANFNKNVVASSIDFTVKDSSGNQVAGSLGYNSSTYTATFTPSAPLAQGTTFTATVSGATDSSGNVMAQPYSWSFTTMSCPCTIFPTTATPQVANANDPESVELGVKFTSDVNGYINGVRFYKGSQNTGPHVVNLWTSSGQLLATATSSNETSSGWQEVDFPDPVAISAGQVYVASYHTNVGYYSYTSGGLANSVDPTPLHALASASSGGNGVYSYGPSAFPSNTYNATNYWVDVVFNTKFVDTTPPTVTAETPSPSATSVPFTTAVTATFSKAVTASTISFTLKDSNGNVVPATVSYDASNLTATLEPNADLGQGVTYTATVSGATDSYGNVMAQPYSWSFTTVACPCSVFGPNATPAVASANDPNPIEVGMKFESAVGGTITAIRFYKGSQNTGPHVVDLWSGNGQLLASATSTNETASGWQQVNLPTPVQIQPNTIYVVSYHTQSGYYSATAGYFSGASAGSWPLDAPDAASAGGNGVYAYGPSSFPTNTYDGTNYWVDVVFTSP